MADVRRSKALALVMQKAAVKDASGNPVDLSELDRRPDSLEELAEQIVEDELDDEAALDAEQAELDAEDAEAQAALDAEADDK